MLFLGLGTGLGTSLIVDGIVEPMESGHLPYKKRTYEGYVGNQALLKQGKKKWRRHVADVVARLGAAVEPDEIVLGGGNAKELKDRPQGAEPVTTTMHLGGFRLWKEAAQPNSFKRTVLAVNRSESDRAEWKPHRTREQARARTRPR